ncbi:MAG: membrane-associated protease 1 [Oscillospiraceae bacterium]|jgi:hypothetical protein|nr:membrane-associated protease 1 [Oscillospiraceae bacterium]
MAYTLKAEGSNAFNLTDETVETLKFENTSSDNSNARARDTYQTITATGRIRSDAGGALKDETINAAKWSLVPAVMQTAYQKITATAVAAGQTTRKYEFSQGFIVSYSEKFTDQSGVGSFAVKIRQKKDQLDQVKVSGGYAAE